MSLIRHNLFFNDIQQKIDNYVTFRRECVEIAILAVFTQNQGINIVSVIDPNIIRDYKIESKYYLDTNGYVLDNNGYVDKTTNFMSLITEQFQSESLYIIFQGYIDKNTNIKAKEPTDEILNQLSIRKMMFVNKDFFKWLVDQDVYYEKNTIFHSYLDKVKKFMPDFKLDKNKVDDFLKDIKQAVRTKNFDFKDVKPILEINQNETDNKNIDKYRDYIMINKIIDSSLLLEAFQKKYHTQTNNFLEHENHVVKFADYIKYFAYDKPSYNIYDLIKDSYMTIQLDKIIIETVNTNPTKKNEINLNSSKALKNLDKIFDIDYFKNIKKEKKDINILFLFYEKLLKYTPPLGNDASLNTLTCIFYSSSIEYNIENHNEKNPNNSIDLSNSDIQKLIQINIVDAIYQKLNQINGSSNLYTIDESCTIIQKQILNTNLYRSGPKLTEIKTGLATFMTTMDQNQVQSDDETIVKELENGIVEREDIINKMIDINKPTSKFRKYLNYTFMTLGVLIMVAPIVLTIVAAATTGNVPVSVQTVGPTSFGFELLKEGKNVSEALKEKEEEEKKEN